MIIVSIWKLAKWREMSHQYLYLRRLLLQQRHTKIKEKDTHGIVPVFLQNRSFVSSFSEGDAFSAQVLSAPVQYRKCSYSTSAPEEIDQQHSPEIEAILNRVKEGKSTLVSSRAGSGKTRLLAILYMIHSQTKLVLALAFNKTAAQELRKRGVATATTYHSYGLSLLRAFFVEGRLKKKCEIKWGKSKALLKACIAKQRNTEVVEENKTLENQVKRLVSLAKADGLGLLGLEELTEKNLEKLNDHYGVVKDVEEKDKLYVLQCTLWVIKESIRTAIEESEIDFDDMIYIPLLLLKPGERFLDGKYTLILMDEAQDTNKTRMEIIAKSLPKEGQIVAVGDQLQAIYGFAGAGADSMSKIQKMFNTREPLPLSVSYRLPIKIIDFVIRFLVDHSSQGALSLSSYTSAPSFVDDIKPAPGAKLGLVELGSFKDFPLPPAHSGIDTAILCRTNAPLIRLFYDLTKKNILCNLLGRKEIGTGMQQILRKALKQCDSKQKPRDSDNFTITYAKHALHLFCLKLIQEDGEEVPDTGSNGAFTNSIEHLKCVHAIIQCLQSDASLSQNKLTVQDLKERLVQFSQTSKDNITCITLSSVHKAKGMGFHRVYILKPENLPSYKIKKFGKKWEQVQELHTAYVAYTRSYSDLIFLQGPGQRKKTQSKKNHRAGKVSTTSEFCFAVQFFELEIPDFCDFEELIYFRRAVKIKRNEMLLQHYSDNMLTGSDARTSTSLIINSHYDTISNTLNNFVMEKSKAILNELNLCIHGT